MRPAGNNAVRKFYTLEGILLEAVLASVLPEGEMTYQQFLGKLSKGMACWSAVDQKMFAL